MKEKSGAIISEYKLLISIPIIVSIVMISMVTVFSDVTVSLNALILLLVLAALSILIILNPFWGVILILAYGPFSVLVEIPVIESGGRLVAIITMIGWGLKYFLREKSIVFDVFKSNKIIILFVMSMLISSGFAFEKMTSVKYSTVISSYMLMSILMQDFVGDERKLKILVTVTALSVGFASLIGLFQYQSVAGGGMQEFGRIESEAGTQRLGGFHNPNGYGRILMSGIPFLLFISLSRQSFILKSLCSLLLVTSVFSLGLTVSRTHIISFAIFIIAYALLGLKHKLIGWKKLLILFLIIAISAVIVSNLLMDRIMGRAQEDISEQKRYFILLKGIDVLKEHPIFGIGLNNLIYVDTSDGKWDWLDSGGHDIVSSIFASIGLVGTTILFIIFYKIFRYLTRAAKIQSVKKNNYLFNFVIVLQASYIACLSSSIGDPLICTSSFWTTYFGMSVLIYRWGNRGNMSDGTDY